MNLEQIGDSRTLVYKYDYCTGVLVDRQTIITAARCIHQSFDYYDSNQRKTFRINVTENTFRPNIQSMFIVYLSVDHFVYFDVDLPNLFTVDIAEIIIVFFKLKIFFTCYFFY
jgi:hypothetical protein